MEKLRGDLVLFWLVNDILVNYLKYLLSEWKIYRDWVDICVSFYYEILYIVEELNIRELKNWNEKVIYVRKVR